MHNMTATEVELSWKRYEAERAENLRKIYAASNAILRPMLKRALIVLSNYGPIT